MNRRLERAFELAYWRTFDDSHDFGHDSSEAIRRILQHGTGRTLVQFNLEDVERIRHADGYAASTCGDGLCARVAGYEAQSNLFQRGQ